MRHSINQSTDLNKIIYPITKVVELDEIKRKDDETCAASRSQPRRKCVRVQIELCRFESKQRLFVNAMITRCDFSLRFFCIDATLLLEFESDKILINEFE